MLKWVVVVVLALIVMPYPAQAFGSFSQTQLNTTNTEQNVTFEVRPYSELVYMTIRKNANITSASLVATGFNRTDGLYTGANFSNTVDPADMTSDGNFIWVVNYLTGFGEVNQFNMNGSFVGVAFNASVEIGTQIRPQGITTNGTYIWVNDHDTLDEVYQFEMDGTYTGINWSTADCTAVPGAMTFNGTRFWIIHQLGGPGTKKVCRYNVTGGFVDSFDADNGGSGTENIQGIDVDSDFIYITDATTTPTSSYLHKYLLDGTYTGINWSIEDSSGSENAGPIFKNETYYWINDFADDLTYLYFVGLDYPENVTIDTGKNGENDYVNDTVFITGVTIDLNVTAINNFLRNETLCPGIFSTATCDVPYNISSVGTGILQISNISVTGEFIFGVFNVSILDEMTGDTFDIAGSDSVILSFFCDNETQNVTITSQGQEVNVLCVVDEVRITVIESADETVRYLVPTTNQGGLNFYVYNSTEETDVIQNWLYFDVTGLYENGIVIVTKVIFDLGERTMIEKIIDSESKTTLYLVVGERYCVSVFDSNRANERDLGCMDADADTEKRISISTIPFSPDQAIPYNDIFITFSWDKDAEIIQGFYNDTLDETNSVTFTVYNATNSSEILFTSTSTSSVVTFTYNNVDVNGTFIARIVADHQRYGIIDPMVTIDFGGKYKVAGLESLGLGIWMSIAGGMISMIVMLAFGKRYAKIGSAVFVFMVLLFMHWGWFDASPQLGWGMLTLIAFIVFGNVISLRRRLQ